MLKTDKNGVLAIVASMLVLFSAMLSPLLTVALVIVAAIIMSVARLMRRPRPGKQGTEKS